MKYEIGYALMCDYYKTSYGQGSWRPEVTHTGFLAWDGTESFEYLIKRQHPEFLTKVKRDREYKNFRIEVISLRIGGEKAQVVMLVEKQVIQLSEPAVRRERVM
jgi:hypothetical protein